MQTLETSSQKIQLLDTKNAIYLYIYTKRVISYPNSFIKLRVCLNNLSQNIKWIDILLLLNLHEISEKFRSIFRVSPHFFLFSLFFRSFFPAMFFFPVYFFSRVSSFMTPKYFRLLLSFFSMCEMSNKRKKKLNG